MRPITYRNPSASGKARQDGVSTPGTPLAPESAGAPSVTKLFDSDSSTQDPNPKCIHLVLQIGQMYCSAIDKSS